MTYYRKNPIPDSLYDDMSNELFEQEEGYSTQVDGTFTKVDETCTKVDGTLTKVDVEDFVSAGDGDNKDTIP